MNGRLFSVSLLVADYDEAIAYFTRKLGFLLVEDTDLGNGKRWVLVRPPGADGCHLLLAKAVNERQRAAVGNQSGGRVWLFLQCDDFWSAYRNMLLAGVRFQETPRSEPYGMVVVFEDLYGNRWDLLSRRKHSSE